MEEGFEATDALYAAIEANDVEKMREASALLDQQESGSAFAKAYGIDACAGFNDQEAAALG